MYKLETQSHFECSTIDPFILSYNQTLQFYCVNTECFFFLCLLFTAHNFKREYILFSIVAFFLKKQSKSVNFESSSFSD